LRDKGKLVIWPAYFDGDQTWRGGRRVSNTVALRGVNADEVLRAAVELGLNPEMRADAVYPRNNAHRGAILVDRGKPKTKILVDLARKMREKRFQR
jgi:signal recognition particle subunit SRP19